MRELAQKSDELFADASALVKARRTSILGRLAIAAVDDVATGAPTEQSPAPTVSVGDPRRESAARRDLVEVGAATATCRDQSESAWSL